MTVATIVMIAIAIGLVVLIYKVIDHLTTKFWYYILAAVGIAIAIAGLAFSISGFLFGLLGIPFGGYLAFDSIRHIATHRHSREGAGSAYVAREDMTINDWGQQLAASSACAINDFFDESSYAYCDVHYYTYQNSICFYADFSIRSDTKYSKREIVDIVCRRIERACSEAADCPFRTKTSGIEVKIKYN